MAELADGRSTTNGLSDMTLLAASARNFVPRGVAAAAMGAAALTCIPGAWVLCWAVVVAVGMAVSLKLTSGGNAAKPGAPLSFLARANSSLSGVVQVVMILAIWRSGVPAAQAFAVAAGFTGASYVLLQYYANVAMFRVLLAPYALAGLYIAWDLARAAGGSARILVLLAAAALMIGNFFYLSRRQLDRSRSALRQARRRAEAGELAAEAANQAKSTFLATMSHEIRTPLNGVLGMTQAMASDELSDRQRERLSVVHQSGEALLAILNDVLDLSKIEAGKLELEEIEFDLSEVARGAHSAFTALANKKGLSFCVNVDAARGRYVGDPTRLRQILYNLISNALKFTEHGEIRVVAARQGDVIEIAVADTGVGISQEGLARLFGKFDQLDSSTTRRFGGTGLGLAICRELAQLMGGAIEVESQVGQGSRFILRVPLARVGEERGVSAAPPPTAERPALALRVLAAEDNSVNQLVLKTLLHQMGVEPVVVDDGVAAVEAWRSGDWDIVLMDVQMPVMDGLAAAAQIRALELELGRKRTPIVALTANAMSHQVEQYLAAGMDTHVAKPIQASALFEALLLVEAEADAKDGAVVAA